MTDRPSDTEDDDRWLVQTANHGGLTSTQTQGHPDSPAAYDAPVWPRSMTETERVLHLILAELQRLNANPEPK